MEITGEPQSASAAANEDRFRRTHFLNRFPARAVGDLSALARLPRPILSPECQWDPGITILLPRPGKPERGRGQDGRSEHRHLPTALTVAELSVVLSAAARAWPAPGSADPLELEVWAAQVQGVPQARYGYQPVRHALRPPVQARRHDQSGDRLVPAAAMILTITSPAIPSESNLTGELEVTAFAAARLTARLVTHAAITAATGLGLISHSRLSQHGLRYRVGISRPIGRTSL